MKTRLKNDIIDVLEYFEYGLADIQEGSGEEQPKLKEIRSILHRLKANSVQAIAARPYLNQWQCGFDIGFMAGCWVGSEEYKPRLFPKGAIPPVIPHLTYNEIQYVQIVFKDGRTDIAYYDIDDNCCYNSFTEVEITIDFKWAYLPKLKWED